jgi:hypothetical protein
MHFGLQWGLDPISCGHGSVVNSAVVSAPARERGVGVESLNERRNSTEPSFDFTSLYAGVQDAFLAAAAVGAIVVAVRYGARWVKKALSAVS